MQAALPAKDDRRAVGDDGDDVEGERRVEGKGTEECGMRSAECGMRPVVKALIRYLVLST